MFTLATNQLQVKWHLTYHRMLEEKDNMPLTRHKSKEKQSPKLANAQNGFEFPRNDHLLITTPSRIFAWDSAGLHTIFKSSKHGVVAAREAQDGSGVLAVADKYVVVLHDTKRGQERSWGLDANEDEVRHLEYTADAKSLFLSTSLTADIQRYSTEGSRLLHPTRAHASPPVALAVSPTGHLLVSASDRPPVVYLKKLAHNSTPILVECRASETAVSVIAFHPERPNIFLLGFRDGTLAAFDGTKIRRERDGSLSNQEIVNTGEISHLSKLHRATAESIKVASITDAAFLPGYKTRAMSVGSDGRCRLIDFADGGLVLRTWHAKAPVTSVSVLSLKTGAGLHNKSAGSRASHMIGGPTSTNNLVAIGHSDGKVHIYDPVGLLLTEQRLGVESEKIISVEWLRGPSPKPIADSVIACDRTDLPAIITKRGTQEDTALASKQESKTETNAKTRRGTTFEHVGLPPALRKPTPQANLSSTGVTRRFTIHPDELEDSTVRHTPLAQSAKAAPSGTGDYLDLFSPMKPSEAKEDAPAEERLASPPRARPRISSQTFVKSSPSQPVAQQNATGAKPRNLALFPSTDSVSETALVSPKNDASPTNRNGTSRVSPLVQKKRISFKPSPRRRSRKSSSFNKAPAAPNSNAKVLADLRKMSTIHPAHRTGGMLSEYSTAKPKHNHVASDPSSKDHPRGILYRPADHIETDLASLKALRAYDHVHERHTWPEDSNQDTSLDGDIWLTSDSNDDVTRSRRGRRQPAERPPARQTSRSRVTSKGTMSTLAQQPSPLAPTTAQQHQGVDGSTDEEMMTADTRLSPSGTFSPSSQEVRELFPRSSSLSPRKRRNPQKQPLTAENQTLCEVAGNAAGRQAKSLWARAKAGKKSAPKGAEEYVHVLDDATVTNRGSPEPRCEVCSPTKHRERDLEDEVAQLKGEILALKAALRRNGISLPTLLSRT